jgi:hypothetical protein
MPGAMIASCKFREWNAHEYYSSPLGRNLMLAIIAQFV